ncbi:Hypothetical_protein [Hexamita inflata]|uniref:Hypothetical_protein n=1 Tax=Hexamita inflata TaxID=28002 RepID=A0AA86N4L8_9EUKA|nr:Hypothetical protein HINF_LOCUS275 [Hexamita inflata]
MQSQIFGNSFQKLMAAPANNFYPAIPLQHKVISFTFETVLHFEVIQSTNFRLNASEPEQPQITTIYTCVVDKQMQNVLTKMYNPKYLSSYTSVTMNILNEFISDIDKIQSDSTKQNELWKQYNEKFFKWISSNKEILRRFDFEFIFVYHKSDFLEHICKWLNSLMENSPLLWRTVRHAFSPYNTEFSRFSVQKRTYLSVVPYTAFSKYSVKCKIFLESLLVNCIDNIIFSILYELFQ